MHYFLFLLICPISSCLSGKLKKEKFKEDSVCLTILNEGCNCPICCFYFLSQQRAMFQSFLEFFSSVEQSRILLAIIHLQFSGSLCTSNSSCEKFLPFIKPFQSLRLFLCLIIVSQRCADPLGFSDSIPGLNLAHN